jgi:hypothetical protein
MTLIYICIMVAAIVSASVLTTIKALNKVANLENKIDLLYDELLKRDSIK